MSGHYNANEPESEQGFFRGIFYKFPYGGNHEIYGGGNEHTVPNELHGAVGDKFAEYGGEAPKKYRNVYVQMRAEIGGVFHEWGSYKKSRPRKVHGQDVWYVKARNSWRYL